MKKSLVVLGLIIVVGLLALFRAEAPSNTLGAMTGPDVFFHTIFHNGLTIGGEAATSSLVTSQPLDKSYLTKDNTRIDFTPNVTGITLTLPASSTLASAIVWKTGDTRIYVLCNATTTATASFTVGFGSGLVQQSATSTYSVASGKCARLIFSRKPNTDINVMFDTGL